MIHHRVGHRKFNTVMMTLTGRYAMDANTKLIACIIHEKLASSVQHIVNRGGQLSYVALIQRFTNFVSAIQADWHVRRNHLPWGFSFHDLWEFY